MILGKVILKLINNHIDIEDHRRIAHLCTKAYQKIRNTINGLHK